MSKDEEIKEEKVEDTKAIKFLTAFEDFFLNIADKIKLKFLSDIYRKNREVWRYLIFGALATVVNIVAYELVKNAMGNAIGNAFAWVVAAIFAYITNRYFVFASRVNDFKGIVKEISSFFGCRLLTFFIDEAIMIVSVDHLHWNSLLMKIIANIIVIILNYVFSKILIFKKKNEDK